MNKFLYILHHRNKSVYRFLIKGDYLDKPHNYIKNHLNFNINDCDWMVTHNPIVESSPMNFPNDFDGAHHVVESRKDLPYDAMGDYSNIEPSKEQERLDNFNKNNPTNNLQDLM